MLLAIRQRQQPEQQFVKTWQSKNIFHIVVVSGKLQPTSGPGQYLSSAPIQSSVADREMVISLLPTGADKMVRKYDNDTGSLLKRNSTKIEIRAAWHPHNVEYLIDSRI